jgi:hypothetical protein
MSTLLLVLGAGTASSADDLAATCMVSNPPLADDAANLVEY